MSQEPDELPKSAEENVAPEPNATQPEVDLKLQKSSKLSRFTYWYAHKKKLSIPLTVVALALIVLAVPASRYAILGTFMKKDVTFRVVDTKSKTPVSGALVNLAGIEGETNADGEATLEAVKVGEHIATITKKYYKDGQVNVSVPILSKPNTVDLKMEATGRQTKVTVTNKISGAVLAGATLKVLGTESKTDDKGEATIVLPAGTAKQEGTLSKTGFNDTKVTIEVSDTEIKQNKLGLTPAGKLYFLSKRTGKIDVMKSNLDGTDPKVVIAGTGSEEDGNTVLLASRDWKYLVLKSRREGPSAKLYLIETANDKMTNIDEGTASFDIVGWNNESFVYVVDRVNIQQWQNKRYALKAYNANNKSLKTLHETAGSGTGGFDYRYEYLQGSSTFAFGGKIAFTKNASHSFGNAPQESSIYVVNNDGSGLKKLKSFAAGNYIQAKIYAPEEIYYNVYSENGAGEEYLEYEDGALKAIKKEDYEKQPNYPTYLLSPSGKENLWSEERDGKSVLFIGDENGENEKIVDSTTPYQPYGWYTDEYILITIGKDAELFIAPKQWPAGSSKTYLKVTSYHKPSTLFYGYGGGYGGL